MNIEALEAKIATSTNVCDLFGLFEHVVPLDKLSHFLRQQLDALDDAAAKKAVVYGISINLNVPPEIIQHMLSFTVSSSTKRVCKQWKDSLELNQNNLSLPHIQEVIAKQPPFTTDVAYEPLKNNTWIIHPTRTDLTSEE
eukprot:771808_1